MPRNFRIIFSGSAGKWWRRIPPEEREKIFERISFLKSNPYLGKKMQGKLLGRRRVRVWPYRIVYRVFEDIYEVEILKIRHRGSIGY